MIDTRVVDIMREHFYGSPFDSMSDEEFIDNVKGTFLYASCNFHYAVKDLVAELMFVFENSLIGKYLNSKFF